MTTDVHEAESARRPRWPWWVGGGLVLALFVGVGAWLGMSWLQTYRLAESTRASAAALTSAVADRDLDAVAAGLPEAARDLAALQESTSGVPWQVLAAMPLVGRDARALSDLAFAADRVVQAGLPLVDTVQALSDAGLRRPDGSLDLDTMAEAAPGLADLSAALAVATDVLDPMDVEGLRPEVADAVTSFRDAAAAAEGVAAGAAEAASYLPGMLGTYGPRTWLLLLQNPAESRGSGGFPGGYVLLTADDGRLSISGVGSSTDLYDSPIPADAADEDAQAMWGDRLTSWNTYSDTPHFPTVGALSAAGMAARGVEIDGVLAFDPATVAAVLEVLGPVEVGGRTFDSSNVERFFLEDVYQEYPDARERDAASLAVVSAVLSAFLSSAWDPVEVLDALTGPLDRQKVRAWSADPEYQLWLESTAAGGEVPTDPGPVVAVAFSNSAANKMDAFVSTSVVYRPGTCPTADLQTSTLEVTMRNEAPAGLSNASGNYGRRDVEGAPEGSTSVVPYLYTPVNATFVSSSIDGVESTEVFGNGERGRAAYFANIGLDRGQERTVSVTFQEPTVAGVAPEVLTHGMARDTAVEIVPDPTCP